MKDILHMIVVLSLICGVSGYSLATVKNATKDQIEKQVLTYVQGPALLSVIGEHDNDPIAERKKVTTGSGQELTVFPVVRSGELAGVALETFAPGYSGDIGVMVGFDVVNDQLMGIGITTQTETPGLGTRIMEPSFTGQFIAHPLTNLKVGDDIDGISGATFSSVGTTKAAKKAAEIYKSLKPEILAAFKG